MSHGSIMFRFLYVSGVHQMSQGGTQETRILVSTPSYPDSFYSQEVAQTP